MANADDEQPHDEEPPPTGGNQGKRPRDPYALLNVANDASEADIQRAYKRGSRALHPDKQAAARSVTETESAQEAFVMFKDAYDILSDPVLRQAYDQHGHYGVEFVRKNLGSSDDASLIKTLSALHAASNPMAARDALDEAIRHYEYQKLSHSVPTYASIEMKCTMVHSALFGEGGEPVGLPEVERAKISFDVETPQTAGSKWSMHMGGSSHVRDGEGSADGKVSVGYEIVPGTEVNTEVEVGKTPKLSLGSTRVMTGGTAVTSSVSTVSGMKSLALSFSSQRVLLQNKVHGSCAMGLGSDGEFHYAQLAFTTLLDNIPRFRLHLNLGVDRLPAKLSIEHHFAADHTGRVAVGLGAGALELKALTTRHLSKYAKFTTGVRHATLDGLTWLLKLERGNVSISVPVTMSTVMDSSYPLKVLYLGLLTSMIDIAIGDVLESAKNRAKMTKGVEDVASLRREHFLLQREKRKRLAQSQTQLMSKQAERTRIAEESIDGLVILRATYGIDGRETVDVTTQLQFWVANSSLHLPASSKGNLMGFFEIDSGSIVEQEISTIQWLRDMLRNGFRKTESAELDEVKLTVRYKLSGGVYEITIRDDEALSLPSRDALKLGDTGVVQ